ncbi:Y+L amino acid transporter 2-like [Watersipora subatra]|uniref:Y+L amino acid transporter 2-like n=1 Tax=Watersipora subatra TaxID=2589382 RepID=UPI00355BB4D2
MWVDCLVIKPALTAIQGLTMAQYMIEPIFPNCEKPDTVITLIAIVGIILLTFINCVSVKMAARLQDASTVAKTLALLIIIITGIVRIAQGHTGNFSAPFANSIGKEVNVGTVSLATYSGLFAYIGWNYLNMVVEEFQKPARNLPISIFVSVTICTLLYTLTNVAYFTTVSPPEMLASSAVAVTFANKIYGPAAWLMPIFVAMSCLGGANGNLLTASRMFFVSAREGHMPLIMAGVSVKRLTPLPAVVVMGFAACLYVAVGDVFTLINYTSFVQWFAIGLSVVALLYIRWKKPDLKRPLKISLFWPISYLIMTVFICAIPLITEPLQVGMGIIIVCTGIPVYILFVKYRPQALTKKGDQLTHFFQKLLLLYPDTDKFEK